MYHGYQMYFVFLIQIDGTLMAPPAISSWPKSSLFQWINFKNIHSFTVQGSGTIDGQGFNWWTSSQIYPMQVQFTQKLKKKKKHTQLNYICEQNLLKNIQNKKLNI